MIRRAQAEALLKLAEALEECERNGLELLPDGYVSIFYAERQWTDLEALNSVCARLAIAKLYPKSEEAE